MEVKVKGHYLQPERAASASSFSPSSLPASDLHWTKTRRGIWEMHRKDVIAVGTHIHTRTHDLEWKEMRSQFKKTLQPVEHSETVPMHTHVCSRTTGTLSKIKVATMW